MNTIKYYLVERTGTLWLSRTEVDAQGLVILDGDWTAEADDITDTSEYVENAALGSWGGEPYKAMLASYAREDNLVTELTRNKFICLLRHYGVPRDELDDFPDLKGQC